MTAAAQKTERTCIVTRQTGPASEMLRFVRGPDNVLVFDIKARLPGRGVWVTAAKSHVENALKKRLFARALKGDVGAAPDLVCTIERQLRSAALGSLGLARKAGQVVSGFASVEAAIRKGGIAALIHASDGADDGRRKLTNLVRAMNRDDLPEETVIIFTADELSLALGRSNVIHAAAMAGHAGEMFVKRVLTAANFCAAGAGERPESRAKNQKLISRETTH